jgi:[acyl-carrier-protein] S-malonyltransferase
VGKVAYLFPGQGSQAVGMGAELIAHSPAAKAVFDEADEALGEKLSATILEGPEEELKRTANTQPAMLTMGVACLRALEEKGAAAPSLVAGHSLGEYSALVAAGALPFADAVRAVRARGRYMQEAVPEGVGAMAAIMMMAADEIRAIVDDVSSDDAYVAVANFNGPMQTVIAGHKAGVDLACEKLKDAGAKKVVPLPVSAPFHCKLMEPVKARLADALAPIEVGAMTIPVVANVDAQPNTDKERVKQLLIEQVTAPVRFTEIAQVMQADGVDTYVEVGPGRALLGMVKRMHKGATFLNVDSPATLDKTLESLG